MEIVSCDLETTGLNAIQDDWITGSFAILDDETLEVKQELELTSRPYRWSREAFEIHKIPRSVAMKFPLRVDALRVLVEWLPKTPFKFLCHAMPHHQTGEYYHFDYALLRADFSREFDSFYFRKFFTDNLVFSTNTLAVELRKKGFLPQMRTRLDVLCDYFGIEFEHHNAKNDRLAMEQVLRCLRELENSRPLLI